MKRRGVKCISIVQVERTKTGSADASRVLQHGLETRLQVAWRARDHPQHLGRCGLLLHSLRSSVRWRSSLSSRANPGMVRVFALIEPSPAERPPSGPGWVQACATETPRCGRAACLYPGVTV